MSQYITLKLSMAMYQEIISTLQNYCSKLDNYEDMGDIVHLIDYLEEEYQQGIAKQNREFIEWQEYEKLFKERFNNEEFRGTDGNLNKQAIHEYVNFNKVNEVLEDYKEGGSLNILDNKQQFFLVLDLINSMDK